VRVSELARFVSRPDEPPISLALDVRGEDVLGGYARWAMTYDDTPNPLIRLEEPLVRALIDAVPAGVALDAACGTGRHAHYLDVRGHRVIGVDASPDMLARARERVPGADFRTGDLAALPLPAASVDLVVCALALSHCHDLGAPVGCSKKAQ